MKRMTILPLLALATLLSASATAQNTTDNMETLELTREWLIVKNSGEVPLDPELIFRRFYHDRSKTTESTGLGLASRYT